MAADASGAPSRAASRPAIVFLHATRLTGAQWASQVAVLSGEFATLTPDLPGHGSAAHERFTLETASLRVADVIAGHGSGPVILVGLSLGGYVAMDVAAREPGLVGGLVLAGASVEPGGVRFRNRSFAASRSGRSGDAIPPKSRIRSSRAASGSVVAQTLCGAS